MLYHPLPVNPERRRRRGRWRARAWTSVVCGRGSYRSEEHTSELQSRQYLHTLPPRPPSDLPPPHPPGPTPGYRGAPAHPTHPAETDNTYQSYESLCCIIPSLSTRNGVVGGAGGGLALGPLWYAGGGP